jgi:formiminotetrahydrofolate cyclodeaminase
MKCPDDRWNGSAVGAVGMERLGLFDTAGPSSIETGTTSLVAKVLGPFAAGMPTPGSGSANAFTAALAAALATSVAKKTLESDHLRYRPVAQLAGGIAARSEKLRVELMEFVELDASVFATVIEFRLKAESLGEKYRQDQARRGEIKALKSATEIPLRIVEIAISVGIMAISMLDQGFQPAKGESYSALTGAIAAADGALCVARLNVRTVQQRVATLNNPKLEAFWLKSTIKQIQLLRVAARPLRTREIRFRRESQRFFTDQPKSTRKRQRK